MFSLNTTLIILAILLITAFAAPLNINMGAYSPALVVGDGAIAFQGSESASKLINTLEGAAVEGTQGANANDAGGAGGAGTGVQAGVVNGGAQNGLEGLGRKVVPNAPKP